MANMPQSDYLACGRKCSNGWVVILWRSSRIVVWAYLQSKRWAL